MRLWWDRQELWHERRLLLEPRLPGRRLPLGDVLTTARGLLRQPGLLLRDDLRWRPVLSLHRPGLSVDRRVSGRLQQLLWQ